MAVTIDSTDVTGRNIVLETGGARDMSFARPTDAADDEYAKIIVAVDAGQNSTISWTAVPSGWTQFIDHSTSGTTGRPFIGGWYKKLASGDTGPFVVSYAASVGTVQNAIGVIQRCQGADASTFEDVADVLNEPSNTASPTASSITTSTSNAEVFYLYAANDGRYITATDSGYPTGTTGMFSRAASVSSSSPSLAIAHKTQVAAGAAGTAQFTNWTTQAVGVRLVTYAIRAASVTDVPTITNFGDEVHTHGETGIVITGTNFNAAQGDGEVIVSPTNDPDDGAAVTQTVTAWSDTSITITAALSALDFDTDLYLFVRNSDEQVNASGYVFQRRAVLSITKTLETKAGAAQTSLSDINWAVYEDVTLETLLERGTGESTDGSGVLVINLTTQGSLNPNADDPVYLVLSKDGAVGSELFGAVKVVPTYA